MTKCAFCPNTATGHTKKGHPICSECAEAAPVLMENNKQDEKAARVRKTAEIILMALRTKKEETK